MTKKFCQGNSLIGLIMDKELPSFLGPVAMRIRAFLAPNYEGTLVAENDAHGMDGWKIPQQETKLFLDVGFHEKLILWEQGLTTPVVLPSIAHNGLETYEPMGDSLENSAVQYKSKHSEELTAGRIVRLVTDQTGALERIKILVRSFRPLNNHEATSDPYRRYPELQARMYHASLDPTIEIIGLGK